MGNKIDTIVIFDFGGQYCHLIGRRIREFGVYTRILPYDTSSDELVSIDDLNIKGIILSGGPDSVFEKDAPKCDIGIFRLGIPVLGICYGHQLIAHLLGGKVESSKKREYGPSYVSIDKSIDILKGLDEREKVWMSHGDRVLKLPREYQVLAQTDNSPISAFRNEKGNIFGIQWHPEVSHTEKGGLMLRNFVFSICGCKSSWDAGSFVDEVVDEIKDVVGEGECIVALSGGVDSSTAALLVSKAVGKKLSAVLVDHGFMRMDEPELVRETFSNFDMNLVVLNEKNRFLQKLSGVKDLEKKRKIIGREFIRVFEEEAKRTGAEYLVQGTIYPDRIESGYRKESEKIKTHHNVAGLPTKIAFKAIIEPLKELYKDEVRKVAKKLGLKSEIFLKQPFPGPGLAVRVIGEVTEEKIELLKKADRIVTDEIEGSKLKGKIWQYFAVLLDTKSTGVKGDSRAYGYTVAIRTVESVDGMTAMFSRLPYEVLEAISTKITNEIPQITRVVYDISNKPPATIEWE